MSFSKGVDQLTLTVSNEIVGTSADCSRSAMASHGHVIRNASPQLPVGKRTP
jgi:hypothetical protein